MDHDAIFDAVAGTERQSGLPQQFRMAQDSRRRQNRCDVAMLAQKTAQASDAGPLSGSTSQVFPHVPPRLPSPRLVGVEAAQ